MRIKRVFLFPLAIAFAGLLLSQAMVFSQTPSGEPKTIPGDFEKNMQAIAKWFAENLRRTPNPLDQSAGSLFLKLSVPSQGFPIRAARST